MEKVEVNLEEMEDLVEEEKGEDGVQEVQEEVMEMVAAQNKRTADYSAGYEGKTVEIQPTVKRQQVKIITVWALGCTVDNAEIVVYVRVHQTVYEQLHILDVRREAQLMTAVPAKTDMLFAAVQLHNKRQIRQLALILKRHIDTVFYCRLDQPVPACVTDVIDAGRIISAAQMHHHDRHSQLSAVTCTVDQPVQHSLSALIGSPDIVDYVKRSVYALILQSGMRKSLGKFADASGARIAGEDTFKSQPAQHCSGVNILHPLDGAVNYPDFSHTSHLSRPTGRYLFTRILTQMSKADTLFQMRTR